MKKFVLLFLILPLIAVLAASCASSVPQEDYDALLAEKAALESELAALNTEIEATNLRVNEGEMQRRHGAIYSALLDLLLYPFFIETELEPRFELEDEAQWLPELKYRVSLIDDQQLTDYVDQLEQGEISIFVVADYIISHTRETLSLS